MNTGRRNFLSLANGLLDKTPETKNGFERLLTAKSGNFLFKFCNFLKYQFFFLFDLFTNKARQLKVAESNQAKASLSKPLLAADEANCRRSVESNSPDVSRLCLIFRCHTCSIDDFMCVASFLTGFLTELEVQLRD